MRLNMYGKFFHDNMDTQLHEIDAVYKEMILDLYRNPLHKKIIVHPDLKNREVNTTCGDEIEIAVKLDNGSIMDIGHQGTGCAISQASVSLLTDHVLNKKIHDLEQFTKDDMLRLLQIPISHTRLKCALLGWEVLKNIIATYEPKH